MEQSSGPKPQPDCRCSAMPLRPGSALWPVQTAQVSNPLRMPLRPGPSNRNALAYLMPGPASRSLWPGQASAAGRWSTRLSAPRRGSRIWQPATRRTATKPGQCGGRAALDAGPGSMLPTLAGRSRGVRGCCYSKAAAVPLEAVAIKRHLMPAPEPRHQRLLLLHWRPLPSSGT